MTILELTLSIVLLVVSIFLWVDFYKKSKRFLVIAPPKLKSNPTFDVIVTELDPVLSFVNSSGGVKPVSYDIELDNKKDFTSNEIVRFKSIKEADGLITSFKIPYITLLKDKTKYYWRVRAVSATGHKSMWATSRFFIDIESNNKFMNLIRIPVKKIEASAGYNVKNIIDWDDPGFYSFWQSPPLGNDKDWIKFDLGKTVEISRIWILSNPDNRNGWLKDFYFEKSSNGKKWEKVIGSNLKENDTFRNVIDFKPVKARYFKLTINDFIGYAAQINEIILYSPGKPPLPRIPKEDYVLVIGNEHNGYTFTKLAEHIEKLKFGLKTVTIPFYEASLEMLQQLPKKPVAVVLSGNNSDYPNLPMFEHNGEFEIIRNTDIPILGICAGHHFLSMAYGYTRTRSMGWSDISADEPKKKMTKIKVLKNDPIFAGIKHEFIAPEVHGWETIFPTEEFEVLAASSYIQATKSTTRLIYSVQFHPEIKVSYNEGASYIENFIKLALEKKKKPL